MCHKNCGFPRLDGGLGGWVNGEYWEKWRDGDVGRQIVC